MPEAVLKYKKHYTMAPMLPLDKQLETEFVASKSKQTYRNHRCTLAKEAALYTYIPMAGCSKYKTKTQMQLVV